MNEKPALGAISQVFSDRLEHGCAILMKLSLREPVGDEEFWEATQTANWAVRNLDRPTMDRVLALFLAAASTGDPIVEARREVVGGNAALRNADHQAAMDAALRGREIALRHGLEREIYLCSALAGAAAQRIGRYDEAADWYDEALVAARRIGSDLMIASALGDRSLVARLRGDSQGALEMVEKAVIIFRRENQEPLLGRTLLSRGVLQTMLGRLDLAQADLTEAHSILSGHGLTHYSNSARVALARVYALRGMSGQCRELLEPFVASADEMIQPRLHVIALEYFGDHLADCGEHEAALATYHDAWERAAKIGKETDVFTESSYRLALAQVMAGKDPNSATRLAQDAVELAERQGDAFELAASLHALGRCLVELDLLDEARAAFDRGHELASRIGDRLTRARIALELSRISHRTGSAIDAVGFATEAKREFLSIGTPRWLAESDGWLMGLTMELAAGMSHESDQAQVPGRPLRTKSESPSFPGIPGFITQDSRVRQTLATAVRLAPRAISILILGDSGTGKEVVAEAIHAASGRKGQLVPVNCGALPGDLLEAELFGHSRGAYTGAERERGGLIEFSHRGTLFLDEIGDMPLKAQARFLRALERGEIRRLGENAPRLVDLRVVAATHRNLLEMVAAGDFRIDLYHRLAGYILTLSPLHERPGDVLPLLDHFLASFMRDQDKTVRLSADLRQKLAHHSWPGNVRQLKNVVNRLVSIAEDGQTLVRLPFDLEGGPSPRGLGAQLEAEEQRRILEALRGCSWNKAKAAIQLGTQRTTLIGKMKRFGIPLDAPE